MTSIVMKTVVSELLASKFDLYKSPRVKDLITLVLMFMLMCLVKMD